MAEIRVRAPAVTLADERTMTAVTGKPPSKPLMMLPTPWALSSRLGGLLRLNGSSLSEASKLSSDSKLATMAMVPATIQVVCLLKADQSGLSCTWFASSPKSRGMFTR